MITEFIFGQTSPSILEPNILESRQKAATIKTFLNILADFFPLGFP